MKKMKYLKNNSIEKQTKKENILELPSKNTAWGFWVDHSNLKKESDLKIIEKLLKKYYNHTIINIKKHRIGKTVYKADNFICKILDKPFIHDFNGKTLSLTLYRTDNINCEFEVDQRSIKLINKSKDTNAKEWGEYLKTDDGTYNFCTSEQLYKLVKGCVIP